MDLTNRALASAHSLPSPDGRFLATVVGQKLFLRTTRSLATTRTITLSEACAGSIKHFIWSDSSDRLLVASADNTIRVFSATVPRYCATIKDPTSETAKVSYVAFGATHDEVLVYADFGLKLTIFNLEWRTSIDIPNPKLYQAVNASKGYAYRPQTRNLALLSRRDGKDVVSIHRQANYEVIRSWNPDTIDAASISWSLDGKWLAVIESAGHGHKILFYAADGHLFKTWKGPRPSGIAEADIDLGAGVKSIQWSADGRYLAVADYSMKITLLSIPPFVETMRVEHTSTIKPMEGLQVWQEQVVTKAQAILAKTEQRTYTAVTVTVHPPTGAPAPASSTLPDIKAGTALMAIDTTGTLIASKMESMPTTIFIWDIASKLLRAVLIQHAPVAKLTWHPSINELLLIRCESDDTKGVAYIWEPTFGTPRIVDFSAQLPEGRTLGRTVIRWLPTPSSSDIEEEGQVPALFFADTQDTILASLSENENEVPWNEAKEKAVDIYGQTEESPLNIVDMPYHEDAGSQMPSPEEAGNGTILTLGEEDMTEGDLDDTFDFKKSTVK